MKKISNFLYQLSGEKNFSWLLEKKFWFFFLVQVVSWFLFYWLVAADIVLKTFLAVGRNPNFTQHVVFSLTTGLAFFVVQIFTAAILPKIKFYFLVLCVLGVYFKLLGFLAAGTWWGLRKFKKTSQTKKIIVGITAFLVSVLILFLFKLLSLFITYPILSYFIQ
jgi:hypothetical protein